MIANVSFVSLYLSENCLTMASPWAVLDRPPDYNYTRLISLNNQEFIIVPQKSADNTEINPDGIYKYNSIMAKWTKIIDYPKDFVSTGHSATIDTKNQIVYIGNVQSKLFKINLNTKSINIILHPANFGEFPGCLFANGDLHVIGSNNHQANKHLVFDNINETFNELYDFNDEQKTISSMSSFIKQRQSIITTTVDISGEFTSESVSVIEFKNDKWTDLNIENCEELYNSIIVATSGGDYLIFIHGINLKQRGLHKRIFVIKYEFLTLF